ncbi:TPA: SymE family type I addiction module toxin [Escherichia fergusonii]|nr:SymE family type I addiction module toxin [Escherichia fergusonii]EFL4511477.1 type I toxin-antitoxin system SymE family toxin [Escherichia fergusonii]EFL4515278.1 type I toxin-antitoxin system SymE family toxin [Escherichia fergusonii]EFN0219267.1 type I toxin-antitoxin system SymE family toxin [Escherichia fergusonii]EFO7695590.1 type I toxin-antitoxin system SymE family toxin [Escherichia fergusonii]EHM5090255.1 SymE family type I addiction module toxin [Escherichia fergusonii]
MNWVRGNGDLYLAGDWLTQCGLTGQLLALKVMPGKVIIEI